MQPDYQFDWGSEINQYNYHKKHLEWERNPRPQLFTHKVIARQNNTFSPILQEYNNNKFESYLRSNERTEFVDLLAKNKVGSLKKLKVIKLIE